MWRVAQIYILCVEMAKMKSNNLFRPHLIEWITFPFFKQDFNEERA